MKKLLLIIIITVFGYNANAQGFRVGLNAGVPVGSEGDFSSFVANIDIEYDWEVSEAINVGASSGVTVFSGKDNFNDFKYIPIAASIDFEISEDLSAGGDIGYAASLESDINSDFLYRLQIRYMASEKIDVQARFGSISGDPGTLSHASIGVGFRF